MYNNYNQIFRTIRKNQLLTQEEFAKKLGVSRSLVAKIEANEQEVSKRIIEKLATNFPNDAELYNLTPLITQKRITNNENYTNDELTLGQKLLHRLITFFEEVDENDNINLKNIQSQERDFITYRKEYLIQDINYYWDWIDNMYSNIIELSILIENHAQDEILNKYGFMSDMRNKYYDEKILYKTGKRPYSEREYSDTLIDVRNLQISQLVLYKNNLQQTFDTFQEIFNNSMKYLKK